MPPSRLLRRLLLRARGTAFGRAHDFAGAVHDRDVEAAFRARVPPQSYESLAPWLARTHTGEADVLWPGVLRKFAVSGGTTGAPNAPAKLLPRSDAHLRLDVRFSRRAAWPLLPLVARGLPAARVLALPGQIGPDPVRPDALTGEVSGLVAHAAPGWARAVQAVAPEALDRTGLDDPGGLRAWETRLERAVDIALVQDIRLLVLVPSWAPVLFDLVRAAHQRRTGRTATTLRDVWPRLGGVVTGGVALASYRAAMEAMVGNDRLEIRPGGPAPVRFIETYGASEGFFAYQTGDARDADGSMALDTDSGVAFEFVPAERFGAPDAPRLTVGEVEAGPRYVPLVSTASGLWAYAIGDVVRFTQVGAAPRLVVAGRTREVLDRYGEAVYADEAAAALDAATRAAGVVALHWHVGADGRGARPRHRWVVSLQDMPLQETSPSAADLAARLAVSIDLHLQAANRHYAIRRVSGAMAAPEAILVPEAAFRAYLHETRARVGAQSKVPRLRDDSEISDVLTRLA